jgi:hypothetical protein
MHKDPFHRVNWLDIAHAACKTRQKAQKNPAFMLFSVQAVPLIEVRLHAYVLL